jgi:hypothetical protein
MTIISSLRCTKWQGLKKFEMAGGDAKKEGGDLF